MESNTYRNLARKFVENWRLNVDERRSLPDGALPGSTVAEEIAAIVERHGWYPCDWRPSGDFDGGLIEHVGGGRCKAYWKVEVGYMRFELQQTQKFRTVFEAANVFAKRFFGNSFDGIPINWTR